MAVAGFDGDEHPIGGVRLAQTVGAPTRHGSAVAHPTRMRSPRGDGGEGPARRVGLAGGVGAPTRHGAAAGASVWPQSLLPQHTAEPSPRSPHACNAPQ